MSYGEKDSKSTLAVAERVEVLERHPGALCRDPHSGQNRGEGGRCAVQVPNRHGDREEGGCRRAKRSETIKAIGDAAANMF